MTRLMAKLSLVTILATLIVTATFTGTPEALAQGGRVVRVSGDLTGNVKWKRNKQYVLEGAVVVKNGAKLKIQAGTTVFGTAGSFLAVEKGGTLVAKGKPNRPIVFTSSKNDG